MSFIVAFWANLTIFVALLSALELWNDVHVPGVGMRPILPAWGTFGLTGKIRYIGLNI